MERVGQLLGVTLALIAPSSSMAAPGPTLSQLTDRLVRDSAILDRPHVRPVHRGAQAPGSLGDALAAHLPSFEAEYRAQVDGAAALSRWKAVASGRGSTEQSEADSASLDRLRAHLDAILAGTHRERADLARAANVFMPAEGATWAGYQLAMAMAGARSRRELAEGDTDAALSHCPAAPERRLLPATTIKAAGDGHAAVIVVPLPAGLEETETSLTLNGNP